MICAIDKILALKLYDEYMIIICSNSGRNLSEFECERELWCFHCRLLQFFYKIYSYFPPLVVRYHCAVIIFDYIFSFIIEG